MTDDPRVELTERTGGKRWGCLLYSLCAVAVLVLVVGLTYLVWYGNAKSELDSEIARILDRGEPLWFSDLEPKRPASPDDDATPLFLLAVAKLKPRSQAFYDRLYSEPPPGSAMYDEYTTTLEANRPALELLAEAVKRPYFRLPIDYRTKQPASVLVDSMQEARDFARLLWADVLVSLGKGDQGRAVAAIRESLGLSDLLRDEPFMITQLVRYAIGGMALESLETTAAKIQLNPDQFAALDDQLDRMFRNCRFAPSILGERCSAFTTMNYLSDNSDALEGIGDGAEALRQIGSFSSRIVRPYLMEDQAYMLRIMSEFADAVEKSGSEGREAVFELDARVRADSSRAHVLTRLLIPAITMYRGAGQRFRQRLLNARLGLRVARYRAEHGELPKTLSEILDDKLATAMDVYSGLLLVYETNFEGFMLYPDGAAMAGSSTPAQKRDEVKKANTFQAKFPSSKTGDKGKAETKGSKDAGPP